MGKMSSIWKTKTHETILGLNQSGKSRKATETLLRAVKKEIGAHTLLWIQSMAEH